MTVKIEILEQPNTTTLHPPSVPFHLFRGLSLQLHSFYGQPLQILVCVKAVLINGT